MTNAHHDAAVQLLTDHQRFVRLVVQREIKGPLEPPQSPRSPLLKGQSPSSGYMSNNRSSYKKSIGSDSQMEESSSVFSSSKATTQSQVTAPITKNGNGKDDNVPQPVPAPRRLTSQGSISGLNGGSSPTNGTSIDGKYDDEETQVSESTTH